MGTRIKDAALVGNVNEGYKIPISDGSNQPKTISVGQLKEYIGTDYIINAGKYSSSTRFENLSEVLQSIPASDRIKRCILYYIDNDFNANLYIYLSNNTDDETWNKETSWKSVYTDVQIEPLREELRDLEQSVNGVSIQTKGILEEYKNLPVCTLFNGVDSLSVITPITLSSNGDYFEAKVFLGVMNPGENYGFAYRNTIYQVGIGLGKDNFSIRANDNSWIAQRQSISESKDEYVFKLSYENDDMVVYIDEVETFRYDGQKALTIGGFGQAASVSSFWRGMVGYLSINGVYYANMTLIEGYVGTNIESRAAYGFLSEKQNRIIESVEYSLNKHPNIIVEPQNSKVNVYTKLRDRDVYAKFGIVHSVNNTDNEGQNGYCNMWGLFDGSTGLYKMVDSIFEKIPNTTLLVGSENEFAINFKGMGDFTGGYHGDERIDLNESDYVEFVADGKPYTFDELTSLGQLDCITFSYRQKSTLYASYVYDSGHKKIAEHFKETFFDDGGFRTVNYIKMDMSELSVKEIEVITAFTGLVCPHRFFAKTIYGDDGRKYTATNPSTSVVLVNNINTYNRKVDMINGNYSCRIDSNLINTSVEDWKEPPINMQIMDRANDSKYYSYLKGNVIIKDGDFLATECSAKFDMKLDF